VIDEADEIPFADEGLAEPAEGRGRYYRGVITRVYYGSESGTLRSEDTGREYAFRYPLVEIRGAIPRIDGLREGMAVGFDLGRTARGTGVTVIRVFD
jgi:hypothetical protein